MGIEPTPQAWEARLLPLQHTGDAPALPGKAPRHGFEPRYAVPETAVLPLDERGM